MSVPLAFYNNPLIRPFFKPSLDKSEYEFICKLKKENPKRSFVELLPKIRSFSWRLHVFNDDQIKEMYQTCREKDWQCIEDIFTYFSSQEGQTQLYEFYKNPKGFLFNHPFPFFTSRENYKWSQDEENLIIFVSNAFPETVDFSMLSLCLPGRTGSQIATHYKELVLQGKITQKEDITRKPLSFEYHKYFLSNVEMHLAQQILNLFKKGTQITKSLIREMARKIYFCPRILAERAVLQKFYSNNLEIYEDIQNETYSKSFLEQVQILQNEIEEYDQNIGKEFSKEIIRIYNLPEPIFGDVWIRNFLKRNHLSWRSAHFARRGRIDLTYASIYINIIAHAVNKYGWSYVFNMDETAIHIQNSSKKTIAPKGSEEVIVDCQRNDKECFTVLGTITKERTLPLIFLSKGSDEKRAREKYNVKKNVEVWCTNTDNCWTNEEIMIRYLKHVHSKFAKNNPCALILDVYPSHRTKNVLQMAGDLNIDLIFVPANGTGQFQPLDRVIYGIIKSKLRSFANKEPIVSGPGRWSFISKLMEKAWSQIENKHLESAWKIDDLEKKILIIAQTPPDKQGEIMINNYSEDFTKVSTDDEEIDELLEQEEGDIYELEE